MTWRINSEKDIFKTTLFKIKRVNLSFPDDKSRDYDMVDIQNAVTVLPIDEEGNIYFVRQYRIGARKSLLELPAGKIELNEEPINCAAREVREETGMSARELIPLGNFYMSPGYANEYMYCFLARGLSHDPLTPDVDEFLEIVRIPLNEARKMIDEREIEDSKTLAIFALADKYLRNFIRRD